MSPYSLILFCQVYGGNQSVPNTVLWTGSVYVFFVIIILRKIILKLCTPILVLCNNHLDFIIKRFLLGIVVPCRIVLF